MAVRVREGILILRKSISLQVTCINKNRMENRNSSPCLRNSFKSKSRLSLSQIIYRSSSVSLEIPNFRYIVLFWVLTVQTDLFRLPATSLSASPLQYSFATSSSVGEREIIMRPFPHQKYLSSCQPPLLSSQHPQRRTPISIGG